ncbi:MAG TPA: hypothetical protein VGW57_13745 [Chthoniobacterales bacterium]|nr:hypothetical protein [Chthoniobacterales bacterium]
MANAPRLADVIRFVVSEVDRLRELQRQDWKSAAGQMEMSSGMPSDDAEFPLRAARYYRCGKVAERKLFECVHERVQKDRELVGRISPETVFHALQVEIAANCVEQRRVITPQLATELATRAQQKALAKAVDRTYFFPVFAVRTADRDEYSIGGASFSRTKSFFERHKEEWDRSVSDELAGLGEGYDPASAKKNIERLHTMAEEYYRGFPAIAAVRIAGAEPKLGQIAAKAILESSFNVLRIFVSSNRYSFIGLAEESLIPSGRSWIELQANGGFLAWHSGRQGEPSAPEDSIARMRERTPSCSFIESIIEKQRTWKRLSALEARLLNGLSWYGNGWKEQVPVAKLVKFAVALETLIMTGSKEAITETLAERIALLCGADTQEREQLYAEARRVYGARSKAVHGGSESDSSELTEVNTIAEKLCVFALISCASLFPAITGVKNENDALTEFFKVSKLGGIEEAAARIGAVIRPNPGASES